VAVSVLPPRQIRICSPCRNWWLSRIVLYSFCSYYSSTVAKISLLGFIENCQVTHPGLSGTSNKHSPTIKNIARNHKSKHCQITIYARYKNMNGQTKSKCKVGAVPHRSEQGLYSHTLATSLRVSCGVNRRMVDNTRIRSVLKKDLSGRFFFSRVQHKRTLISLCSRN
jgi:hypothetical protein